MKFKTCQITPLYQGFYRLDRYAFTHELYNGGESGVISREILQRGHAVGVLPFDPINDTILLIEQFRAGPVPNNEPPWMIEIIAGMVGPGETPEDVARREAAEEAGLSLTELQPMTRFYSSPGGTSETIALFLAITDLTDAGGTFGLASEGEDIHAKVWPYREALAALDSGVIQSSPATVSLLWLSRFHDSLIAEHNSGSGVGLD